MSQGNLFLYSFVLVAFISVGVMLFTRTIFYAALLLIVCLLSIAGIYALLYAEFLAITQIVIYAGGVLVLILFGIMVTNRIAGKPLLMESHHVLMSAVISIGMFITIVVAYQRTFFNTVESVSLQGNHINQIGIELMSTYVAPFEISGLLLLVCLVGAALTASSFNKNGNV